MPTTAEFVYSLIMRDIDGQARDLENMRSHLGIAISAGGVVAAIFAAADDSQSVWFWLGAASFAGLVVCAIRVFWPLQFRFNPATSKEVEKYLRDPPWRIEDVAKDLAKEASEAHNENQTKLDRRWKAHRHAFLLLAAEVAFFLFHTAFAAGSTAK